MENDCGHMCLLWPIVSTNYRWAKTNYDIITRLFVGLTNHHVRYNSLTCADSVVVKSKSMKRLEIGTDVISQRKKNSKDIGASVGVKCNFNFVVKVMKNETATPSASPP